VVTVSQPLQRPVTDYAMFTGRTAAVESVEVRARVSGYLQDIAFQPGEEVKAGQLLFQIEPRIYQAALDKAQADVKQFQAQVALAKSEYERATKLATSQAISREDFEKFAAQRDQAIANLAAAKAVVETADQNLAWTKVTAPVAGKTSVNLLTKGNLVVADQTLLTTIVSQDPMYVYFDVDESTVLHIQRLIRAGKVTSYRDAQYPVEIGLSNEKGFPHRGVIDYVSNQVNTGTGTLNVRGTFPNQDRVLTPGLFCRVRIPVGRPHQAILVTDRALGSDQGQRFVLVVDAKNEVVRRDVAIGALHDGGLREITSGLNPDEWVIVDGLLRVRPGVTVEPRRQPMPENASGPGSGTTAPGGGAPAAGGADPQKKQ
jgi:RND family efflux transporter MFP subunit